MNRNYQYPSKDPILKLKQEMKLRKFSQKTVKSYLYYITDLLKYSNRNPKTVNTDTIRQYLEYLADKDVSSSTLNSAYSALKFYFEKILRRKFFMHIPRSKKSKKLPEVFTKSEIKIIFSTIQNVKHKLLMGLMYSSGLRVSEVTNVKVGDLDFENNMMRVRQAKGAKDRMTILSGKMRTVLQKYTKNKNADNYIFESNSGGKLTERTA